MADKAVFAESIDKIKGLVLHPKRWGKREITVAFMLLLVIAGISMFAVRGYSHHRAGRLIDLGNHYMEGLDFIQAEASFNEVLTIEPRNVEAYLGLFEVYARQRRFVEALDIVTRGYEATGDVRLKEKIDMIESGQIYDSLGRELKMTKFSNSGYVQWYHEYSYNSKGQMVTVIHKNVVGRALGRVDLKYDDEGNALIHHGFHSDTGILFKSISEYENGQMIRATLMELDGTVTDERRYKYDSNGNKIESHRVIKEGEHAGEYRYTYSYNENDNCVRWDIFDADENEIEIAYTTFSYDNEGNKIAQEWYSIKTEYGSENDEDRFFLKFRIEYEYDEDGTPVRETDYDGEGRVTGTYDYFDPEMNRAAF